MNRVISDTEKLHNQILKSAKTISDQRVRIQVENWLESYYIILTNLFSDEEKALNAINYLRASSSNCRLIRKRWLFKLNVILKNLKESKYSKIKIGKKIVTNPRRILDDSLLIKIKNSDKKVYTLGKELNYNWDSKKCWNSCGILMRIILERSLDKKSDVIKRKEGLKKKINFCLSSNVFGKSVLEALKKLDNSTKITGDIVAHDSSILLTENDIELAIVSFRVLLLAIF